MRLFVALDPPAPVRDALAALRRDVAGARWTPAEKMHLTLAFVGEVDGALVPTIEDALTGIVAGPVETSVEGIGAFPNRRAPRVLVAHVAVPPALAYLHEEVTRTLATARVEPEHRPFRPHLTLARLKETDRRAVEAFLDQPVPMLGFAAEALHLYESVQRPEGARYRRVRSYPLTKSA
jgi:2'-5' RNA ligase